MTRLMSLLVVVVAIASGCSVNDSSEPPAATPTTEAATSTTSTATDTPTTEHSEPGEPEQPDTSTAALQEVEQCYQNADLERWGEDAGSLAGAMDSVEPGSEEELIIAKTQLWRVHSCGFPLGTPGVYPAGVCTISALIDMVDLDEAIRILIAAEHKANESADRDVLEQSAQQCGISLKQFLPTRLVQ